MRTLAGCGPSASKYGEYLTMQLALHAPLESDLTRWLPLDWVELRLRKSDWLREDLNALGVEWAGDVERTVRVGSWAQAMGVLYVLEGSTLGLQVVRKSLQDSHPGKCDAGRFLRGYGPHTGRHWRTFLERFEGVAEAQWPEAIDAAHATFGSFLDGFTGVGGRPLDSGFDVPVSAPDHLLADLDR